jgi:hypothetical protein
MAEIYNFKGKDEPEEESCSCEFCDLALEFIDYVKDCESDEDLFIVLRGLVTESAKLQLKEYLNKQIQNNIELIDILDSDFDE